MFRIALVLSAAAVLAACDRTPETPILRPTPLPPAAPVSAPPAPPAPLIHTMTIGEDANGTFTGNALGYDVTSPADGWLVVTLTWDVWYNGSLLTMSIGSSEYKPTSPGWSPLQLRWPVTAGQTYRLFVGPGGTDWWYNDPFVLTTRLE